MNLEQRERVIFSGTYERTLDAKNRVTIPSVWVDFGVTEFQVVPSSGREERYLIVMPPWEFARVEEKIMGTNWSASEKQKAIRRFYTSARMVVLDKQGRLLLPEEHCQWAGLGQEVALLGAKDRFEIWDAGRWKRSVEADEEKTAAILSEAGL